MDDRRQDAGRDDRSVREQQGGEASDQRSVTTSSRQGGSGGDWQGYVVPYRYYGPGYQGVGYYSVMYQGPGEQTEAGQRGGQAWEPGGSWQGQGGGGSGVGQGERREMGGTRRRGFAGRGPKNYQRSDERLRDEVSDRLMEHDSLDAGDIEVEVRGGEVTLTGTVPDRWTKRLAEDIAEQVMGVRDVMNQIRVQGERESQGPTSSPDQAAQSSRASTQGMGERQPGEPNGKRRTASSGTR